MPYFYLISYALFSSCQFISVVGGFVSFSPLIAHLFIVLSMINLLSRNYDHRIYFQWKRVVICNGTEPICWAAFPDVAAER